jgi:hypothetical protein
MKFVAFQPPIDVYVAQVDQNSGPNMFMSSGRRSCN